MSSIKLVFTFQSTFIISIRFNVGFWYIIYPKINNYIMMWHIMIIMSSRTFHYPLKLIVITVLNNSPNARLNVNFYLGIYSREKTILWVMTITQKLNKIPTYLSWNLTYPPISVCFGPRELTNVNHPYNVSAEPLLILAF